MNCCKFPTKVQMYNGSSYQQQLNIVEGMNIWYSQNKPLEIVEKVYPLLFQKTYTIPNDGSVFKIPVGDIPSGVNYAELQFEDADPETLDFRDVHVITFTRNDTLPIWDKLGNNQNGEVASHHALATLKSLQEILNAQFVSNYVSDSGNGDKIHINFY